MGTRYKGKEKEVKALDSFIKLIRAAESVSARVHGHLSGYNLTISQFGVLDALYHLGPLSQGDLGKKILKSSGNITMVVDNLEKRGLVRRERSEKDRRLISVSLTETGKALFTKILPLHVKSIVKEMSILEPREQEAIGSLCKRLGKHEKR